MSKNQESPLFAALLRARTKIANYGLERTERKAGPVRLYAFDLDELFSVTAKVLAEEGLILFSTDTQIDRWEEKTNNGPRTLTLARVTYTLAHAGSGLIVDLASAGIGAASPFAVSVALSAARRKLLEETLGLRGMDEQHLSAQMEQRAPGPQISTAELVAALELRAADLDDAGLDTEAAGARKWAQVNANDATKLRAMIARCDQLIKEQIPQEEPPKKQAAKATTKKAAVNNAAETDTADDGDELF